MHAFKIILALHIETASADAVLSDNESYRPIFMPPTSGKLRGHIGLGLSVRQSACQSVRLSVTLWQLRYSRTTYARILKLYIWNVHER